MTNQAQRSSFLYPVQRTIKPIAIIPRSAKPRGARKFHIAPSGNLRVSSRQVDALPNAGGMDTTKQREKSRAEINGVLRRIFMGSHFLNSLTAAK